MNFASIATAALLTLVPVCAVSGGESGECFRAEVETHVREQFALYGPLSERREYFGFIYRHHDVIQSAVTRSGECHEGNCLTETAQAAALIPRGAKVLGEWHTHPHDGSSLLSAEDVRGARNNQHIRCYSAFYSKPDGEILSWEPVSTSVPTAMASRAIVGNYAERQAAIIDAQADHEM